MIPLSYYTSTVCHFALPFGQLGEVEILSIYTSWIMNNTDYEFLFCLLGMEKRFEYYIIYFSHNYLIWCYFGFVSSCMANGRAFLVVDHRDRADDTKKRQIKNFPMQRDSRCLPICFVSSIFMHVSPGQTLRPPKFLRKQRPGPCFHRQRS